MTEIHTDRLLLRAFTMADVPDVFSYAKSPKVGPDAGWKPHERIEDSAIVVDFFINSGDIWAICLRETGRVIGSIGLHRDPKRGNPRARMLGYSLSEDYWGQGIATEAARAMVSHAFLTLGADIVSIYTYGYNVKSQRVAQKCGFRLEGILREGTARFDGAVLDDVCFSLTREEFEKLQ